MTLNGQTMIASIRSPAGVTFGTAQPRAATSVPDELAPDPGTSVLTIDLPGALQRLHGSTDATRSRHQRARAPLRAELERHRLQRRQHPVRRACAVDHDFAPLYLSRLWTLCPTSSPRSGHLSMWIAFPLIVRVQRWRLLVSRFSAAVSLQCPCALERLVLEPVHARCGGGKSSCDVPHPDCCALVHAPRRALRPHSPRPTRRDRIRRPRCRTPTNRPRPLARLGLDRRSRRHPSTRTFGAVRPWSELTIQHRHSPSSWQAR